MAQRGTLVNSFLVIGSREREQIEDRSAEGIFYAASPDIATASPHLGCAYLQPETHMNANFGLFGTTSFDSWGGAQLSVAPIAVADQPQNHEMTTQAIPNDARYTDGSLWGMYGDASGPANQFGSQAAEAWAQGHTGSMTNVIGVIDTGIDYTHPDLYLNIWLNQREIPTTLRASLSDIDSDGLITFRDLNGAANASYVLDYNSNGRIDAGDLLNDTRWENGIDEEGNGYTDDLIGWDFVEDDNDPRTGDGHGTHVAGTIGALGGNGIGVVGVNWNIQLVALNIHSWLFGISRSDSIHAIDYFTNTAVSASAGGSAENFIATNNSWGGGTYSQELLDAITRAAQQDILFIAAAGNNGTNNEFSPSYPDGYSTAPIIGYEAVISVASITNTGSLSDFSNFGANSVDIAAPGSDIWSTLPNGRYGSVGGTSMATPHVTGAIALYASLFPNATGAQIREALLLSATFTDSVNDLVASDGRLNIPAMLAIAPPSTEFADWLDGTISGESLNGLGGNDTLDGRLGADSLLGGAGIDLLSYADATAAVTVSLAGNLASDAAGSDSLSGFENVLGGVGADSLLGDAASNQVAGGAGADTLDGGGGDDSLIGGAGIDSLMGGAGIDLLSYADATGAVTVSLTGSFAIGAAGGDSLSGFENLLGGVGADSLLGDATSNQIAGGAGADTLNGGLGADSLIGDAGSDSLIGGAGIDLLSYADVTAAVTVSLAGNIAIGAAGSDSLSGFENVLGGVGADSLLGDAASNQVAGGAGADTLDGGGGDDSLIGGAGIDSLMGGAGIDLLSYADATGAVTVSLTGSFAIGAAGGDSLSGFENLLGGVGADSLLGDATSNQIAGGAGADTLDGGDGADTLIGGAGFDSLIGGAGIDLLSYADVTAAVTVSLAGNIAIGAAGDDSLSGFENLLGGSAADSFLGNAASNHFAGGAGADTLDGGNGADSLIGGAGFDSLIGGAGIDIVSYADATGAVTVSLAGNLASGTAGDDSLSGFENVLGGDAADSLLGDASSNHVAGGTGADTLDGGDGADTLIGGAGFDSLIGGAGIDIVSYADATGAVKVSLTGNLASGAAGDDIMSGFENVLGGRGADSLLGDAFANSLLGDVGDDTLDGIVGPDTLIGGDGQDFLIARAELTAPIFQPAQPDPLLSINNYLSMSVGVFSSWSQSAPAFSDLDKDGDQDLVIGRSDGGYEIFLRNSTGWFAASSTGWGLPPSLPPFTFPPSGAYNSAPSFVDLDMDGDLDAVMGRSDGTLSAYRLDSVFVAMDGQAGRPVNPFLGIDIGTLSKPTFTDLDLDGDADLVIGRNDGTLSAFLRNPNGSYSPMDGLNERPANPFLSIDVGNLSTPSFVDLDSDGDQDLVVGSELGTLTSFRRGADGSFSPMDGVNGRPINPFQGIDIGAISAPSFVDLNGDSVLDLVIGSESRTFTTYFAQSDSDRLDGGNGADTLTSGSGADRLIGGAGNDLFIISHTLDLIIEASGDGADTIITSVSMNLPENVEALHISANVSGITVTGGAGHDVLVGNGLSNSFSGGAGDDVILTGNVTLADIYALFAT